MKYCRIKDVPINVGHYYIKCHPRSKIIFEEGDNISYTADISYTVFRQFVQYDDCHDSK